MSGYSPSKNSSEISQLRFQLALALGFTKSQAASLAEPYLNYIENRRIGDGSVEEFFKLFIKVVLYFRNDPEIEPEVDTQTSQQPQKVYSVQTLVDYICASPNEPLFAHTKEYATRRELVTDTVLYILGAWVAMLNYFVRLPGGYRQIELAYYIKQGSQNTSGFETSLERSFAGFLQDSGLLPFPYNGMSSLQNNRIERILNPSHDTVTTALSNLQTAHSVSDHNETPQRLAGGVSPTLQSQLPGRYLSSNLSALASSGTAQLHTRIDSLESLSIKSTTLNAYTLSSLGGVRIHWTINLSRHLLLSRFAGRDVLEVFSLPCVLKGGEKSLCAAGVPPRFIHEVLESYSIIFSASSSHSIHSRLINAVCLRWCCWCHSCAMHRLRQRELAVLRNSKSVPVGRRYRRISAKSEFDPFLEELMRNADPEDWSYDLFPHLWERIVALEEHLGNSKPWNFWVLLRDRRDTLQFWTFFFGTVILLLTVAQVGLGAAQVAGSFL